MNQKNITIILVIVLVIVAGFYALNGYIYQEKQEPNPAITDSVIIGENLEGEADPARMKLDMKEWIWISALYNDERQVKPIGEKEGKFTLTFDGADAGSGTGRFSAKTDCNSMGGSYSATSTVAGVGEISFSQIFSTKMYCEGSMEQDFATLLGTVSGYHFTSRGQLILDLKFDSGSMMFR